MALRYASSTLCRSTPRIRLGTTMKPKMTTTTIQLAPTMAAPSTPRSLLFMTTHRQLSTPSTGKNPGIFGRIQGAFEERSKRQQQQKYAEQLEKMANAQAWTLGDFADELNSTLNSWRSKMPGVSSTKQMQDAKNMQLVVNAVVDELGRNSTASDMQKLKRTEKLRIALKSENTVENLNVMIEQFASMDVMHKVLRKRKIDGRPIPKDEVAMKKAIQTDASRVLTKSQKRAAQERATKQSRRR